ncbi:SusC/RagA family TonB-linked outer membrane protein [Paraflavitalea soli]|uniref:SusC/RagA family TonB-linked outer membrane protein n=1 Tax=Paraflavitalea soli TaxID=2315862 RepID=A0A3B7MJ20_9BACT|nr:SusC/RagA family TonB-linked outer membrane protein [Paraflavitalea soli]AXY74412.1 SusC/RagA family TonB-linked outer membrane protein [Paraflavitalea soli]
MMKKFFLSCVLLCLSLCMLGQEVMITGVISDAKGAPLPGVSIKIKGTERGVTTNDKGFFSIPTKVNDVLEISYVGYAPQTVKVVNERPLSIKLAESNSNLTETVVIGYQKVTRKKNTAAISSISGKELANLPAASFDQLLQGRLSGVNVQNFSGAPGATPSVSVRGSSLITSAYDENTVLNTPLYVVDGVPQPTETYVGPGTGTGMNYLGGVNPNDIESIDVLKDASAAAIYGSRAANGVILITTKKGRSGAPKVIVSGYAGIVQRPELRDVTLGVAERRAKMDILLKQLEPSQKRGLPYLLTDSLNPAFNGNTDWQDMFYQSGSIKSADLSLSGGSDGGTNYRFSTNYYDEKGIIKATGFKRYTMRLNLGARTLGGKLEINPIINYSRTDKSRGNGDGNSPISLGAGNMPTSLFNLDPNKKAFLLGQYEDNLDKNISNQFNFTLNLGYNFNSHLRLTSLTSYIYRNARRDYNRTSELMNDNGNYSYTFSDNGVTIMSSNYLSYVNSFGKHNLSVVGGQEFTYDQYQYTTASGSGGASDQIQVVQGFQQLKIGAYSDYQAYGLLSYYGRMAYDFDGKYLLSGSVRTDGSSRFGEDNKWGFFPSASAAWIMTEESWMKGITNTFSMIKLRASLGTSGAMPNENYLQYNLYNVNDVPFNGNDRAGTYNSITAVTPNFYNGAAQKGLSWERSKQWNIGTDVEIQNGKYSASLDFYNKENSFGLFSVLLPVTSGYDVAKTNSIGVRNYGVELTLAANLLPSKSELKWFSRLNIGFNKNKIMNLPNGGRDLVLNGDRFDKNHILSVGSPINAFYLYKTLGVYATDKDVPVNPFTGGLFRNPNGEYRAGDFQFADLDGDYLIDVFNEGLNPDKMPVGDPNPKVTGGITNNFTWKNLSLSVFCTFTFGRDVLNLFKSDRFANSQDGSANYNFARFSIADLNKYNIWREPGDKAEYAKYDLGSYRYYYTSAQTFFLEKGDYFRVKSIILGYDLSRNLLSKFKIDRFKVFGSIDNVAMFQRSKDLPDAEAVNSYGEYSGAGYPIPRKFTLGLEVQF